MATSPYLIWPAQASSSSSSSAAAAAAATADAAGFGFGGAVEDQAAVAAAGVLVSPEFAGSAVARPRLRRQPSSTGTGKQPQQQVVAGGAGGGAAPRKPPQRGLGVAELERLRCGGDPLRDLSLAAVAMGDAGASVHGNSVLLHHHLPPGFDAATAGSRYYSPLLVQHPATLAAPVPMCYVQSHSSGGQNLAPEQPFMDRWGHVGGFASAGNAGLIHQNLLPAPAPEHPSSQSTVWRPASSSAPPSIHTGHHCELCSMTMRAFTEGGSRVPAPAPAANMPDYSIYDLAATMDGARKETGEEFQAREGKKEVREIEFFPTSTSQHAESEFATARWTTTPASASASASASSSSSGAGGCAAPLDLSLKL